MRSVIAICFGILIPLSSFGETFRVNTKEAPPYSFSEAGIWKGTHIVLFEKVLSQLHHDIHFNETDLFGLVEGVRSGTADASVAAITVTADRLVGLEASLPLSTGYLSVASVSRDKSIYAALVEILFSLRLWGPVFLFLIICALVGELISVFEIRGGNKEFKGLWSSIWFSVVTTTTTGYGDLAPKTKAGRSLTMVFMIASAFSFSIFTGAISAAITGITSDAVQVNEKLVKMDGIRVAVVANSFAEKHMKTTDATVKSYKTLDKAIEAVEDGEAKALVHDRKVLLWELSHRNTSLVVSKDKFAEQYYVVLFPEGSPYLPEFNRTLLKIQQKM